jgi:hypothetical protein
VPSKKKKKKKNEKKKKRKKTIFCVHYRILPSKLLPFVILNVKCVLLKKNAINLKNPQVKARRFCRLRNVQAGFTVYPACCSLSPFLDI